MTVKTNGAEWKRFYSDPEFWPEGVTYADETITVNGNVIDGCDDPDVLIDDSFIITITDGVVFLHEDDVDGPTLEAYFKRWRKKQTTAYLVVEVSKEKVETVIQSIQQAGGKVLK